MTKLWCKLYNFILNIFNIVVDAVTFALSTIGRAVVDVLGEAVAAVGDVVGGVIGGGFSSIVAFVGLGFLAYFLLIKDSKNSNSPTNTRSVSRESTNLKANSKAK